MTDTQLSQAALLDNALAVIGAELTAWGIDNYLGYRPLDHGIIRLSVSGATNVVALINTLNGEIERLTNLVNELDGRGVIK